MQSTEHREKRPKKKRYLFYAFIVILLGIAIIIISTLLLTHVQKISIDGNEYITDDEIAKWVQDDPYARNSLYILWKYKTGRYKIPPNMEKADISLSAPWTVKVQVKEKKIVAYTLSDKDYVYFDKDGLVIARNSEFRDDIPGIEGIEASDIELYKVLPVKDTKVFKNILDVTEVLKRSELIPERIVCQDADITLYFGTVCVQLGKGNLEEKIIQISPILEKLGDQSGTLHLEHFSEGSETISFEKGVIPEEKVENE
ncbi:MAG: hypothetical protein RSA90_00365 [Lachnospiraceae bacterium]